MDYGFVACVACLTLLTSCAEGGCDDWEVPCPDRVSLTLKCLTSNACETDGNNAPECVDDGASTYCELPPGAHLTIGLSPGVRAQLVETPSVLVGSQGYPDARNAHVTIDGLAASRVKGVRFDGPAWAAFEWQPLPPNPAELAITFGSGTPATRVDVSIFDVDCEMLFEPPGCAEGG